MCNAAANCVMSCAAGDLWMQMMLGWLLALDGVFALDGVVLFAGLSARYGVCCDARCQSTSTDVMSSPRSSPAMQYASQCPHASNWIVPIIIFYS